MTLSSIENRETEIEETKRERKKEREGQIKIGKGTDLVEWLLGEFADDQAMEISQVAEILQHKIFPPVHIRKKLLLFFLLLLVDISHNRDSLRNLLQGGDYFVRH